MRFRQPDTRHGAQALSDRAEMPYEQVMPLKDWTASAEEQEQARRSHRQMTRYQCPCRLQREWMMLRMSVRSACARCKPREKYPLSKESKSQPLNRETEGLMCRTASCPCALPSSRQMMRCAEHRRARLLGPQQHQEGLCSCPSSGHLHERRLLCRISAQH